MAIRFSTTKTQESFKYNQVQQGPLRVTPIEICVEI
jgi:hypothetical protein